jgi:zinc-ribbon domain
MPFCHKCGAQNEPEANYCEECGSPLVTVGQPESAGAAPPAPPEVAGAQASPGPTPPAGPPMPGRAPWRLLGILVLVAAVIGGGVAVYVATSGGDEDEGALGGQGKEETVVDPSPTIKATQKPEVTPKPTALGKATPTPKKVPMATPTKETSPPPANVGAQVKAIAVFIESYGEQYAGDCESTNVETDAGKYCSKLWEDRGDSAIYVIGLTFSEFDTWLLLEKTDGDWAVTDWLGVTEEEPEPPW